MNSTHDPQGTSASSSRAAWIGLALSVVAVVLLLRRVSFHDLRVALATADLIWLGPSLGFLFAMFFLRAWRWSILLGGTPLGVTWHANMIGYMLNITLPLRIGEVARAYVIGKNTKVSMASAISAVLVERLIDLAAVVLMFAWFTQRVPMRPAFTRAAELASIAIVLALASAVVLVEVEAVERKLVAPLLARFGGARAAKWLRRFHDIRDGLRILGSPARAAQCFVLTVLIWAATIALALVSMKAFLPANATFTPAGFVVVMANLGGALPSAPGGLGIVQGFATSALVLPFGVPESTALAYVLVWSLGQQLVLVLWGLLSMGRLGLRFREVRQGAQRGQPVAVIDPKETAD